MSGHLEVEVKTCPCKLQFLSKESNQRLLVLSKRRHRIELCGACSSDWVIGGKARYRVEQKVIAAVQAIEAGAVWPSRHSAKPKRSARKRGSTSA